MRRPFGVTAVGWFLIVWNLIVAVATLPQDLFGLGVPLTIALLTRAFSPRSLFVVIGIAILRRKQWARVLYLLVGPGYLAVNLVNGLLQFGATDIAGRLPSLLLTSLFVAALLRPAARNWFRRVPMPPAASTSEPTLPPLITPIGESGASNPSDEDSLPDASHSSSDRAGRPLEETAADLKDDCRLLVGAIAGNLRRSYPDFFEPAGVFDRFIFFGTVAAVSSSCHRLHLVGAKERIPSLEMLIREKLSEWRPDAVLAYQEVEDYAAERLLTEPSRRRQGHLSFESAATWAVEKSAGGRAGPHDRLIARELAAVLESTLSDCWQTA